MTEADNNRKSAEDAFTRASLGLPLDHKLRSMSYISLCDLLSSFPSGSTQFLVVEAEKRRRDAMPSPTELRDALTEVGAAPSEKPGADHWYKKPIPVISFAIIAGIVVLCIRFIAVNYFGFTL